MVWERLKRIFGRGEVEICWVEAADNPWGVRVLDVRPVTHSMILVSRDEQHAVNAISWSTDDGSTFIGEEPSVTRIVETNLRFPIDRVLAEGVLFAPADMDQKWALFYHGGKIICVDS